VITHLKRVGSASKNTKVLRFVQDDNDRFDNQDDDDSFDNNDSFDACGRSLEEKTD
jgi:hypothetical protein